MKFKTVQHAFLLLLLLLPVVTLAQFTPLVGIPGINDPSTDLNTYINVLYALSISIAALLAVIKIIIAGVKYMLSDLISSKQQAKSDIQGALLGLLIVISAVLILNVINPQLTQTNLFFSAIDRAPYNNSALPNTGGSASPAPAAPVSTTQCLRTTDSSGAEVWDCSATRAACTAQGGFPSPLTNWTGTERIDRITCLTVNRQLMN